jgi:hypothetical protein
MKTKRTTIEMTGRTGRTIVTTSNYGNTKKVTVEYPNRTSEVVIIKL